jgi:UDP-N-acetylmuramyl pentapeptide synthase
MMYPILAGVALALGEGIPLDRILPSLEALPPTPGRLQPIQLRNRALILRDEFKSPLETMETALDVLSEIPARRRIAVLGDVTEPIGSQGPIYRQIGERLAKIASRVILVGGMFQAYGAGATRGGLPRSALFDAGRSVIKAVEALPDDLGPGDVVLVKGRRSQRLERVPLALVGRTVRCDIGFCNVVPMRCEDCRMLERGWGGLRVVI